MKMRYFDMISAKKTLVLLMTMMMAWMGQARAQRDDLSGVYYIASHGYVEANTTTNYYLCQTENWAYYQSTSPYYYLYSSGCNTDKPFMTTYRCRNGVYNADKAVWVVEKQSNGYYHIKRAIDGKYLTYNDYLGDGNKGRMRVHLEATADGDNALFEIIYVSGSGSSTIYDIKTKNGGPDDVNRKYLNVTGNAGQGNQNSLQATSTKKDGPNNINVGGIIGLWTAGASGGDVNSSWCLEPYVVSQPSISFNSTNNQVTISSAVSGVTLYYTTDDTDPTTSNYTGTGQSPLVFTQTTPCTVKAIAVKYGVSSPVTPFNLVSTATPTFTFNNSTNQVTITCTTSGATIYYTTDGSDPTTSHYTGTGQSPLVFTQNTSCTVKAIAVKEGLITSNATFNLVSTATPTFTFNNSTNEVTIACATQGATIYYTTDGSQPSANNCAGSGQSPLVFTQTTSCTIKAIAVKEGYITSDGTFNLGSTATPTFTFNNSTNEVTIACATQGATIYYTTDDSQPSANNCAGSGQSPLVFTQNTPCTVNAIAMKEGLIASNATLNLVRSASPTINVDTENNQVSITAASASAIYYTFDLNAEPDIPYNPENPISIEPSMSGQAIVRAKAIEDNKLPSDVVETMVIYPTLASPPSITYDNDTQKITITHGNTPAENYTIRWTIYESLLVSDWTAYSAPVSPITPLGPCTVKAIVVENTTNHLSAITTLNLEQVATPTTALIENQIVLSCATSGASIYYTKNGTSPTLESLQYSSPLGDANAGLPIRAIAVKAGMVNSSPSASAVYPQVATPVIADNGNNHIAITSATADATIYYTIDGNAPALVYDPATNTYSAGANTLVYTEPLDSSHSSLTIKAIAVKQDMFNSAIGEGVVYLQCPDPVITINSETGAVSITCDLAGATICYTTNGTDPNPDPQYQGNSWPTQVYNGSITLQEATTVKALASRTGCYNSNIATQTFEQATAPELAFTNQLTINAGDATVKYQLDNEGEWANYDNSQPLQPTTSGLVMGTTELSVKSVEPGKVPFIIAPFVLDQVDTPVIAEDGNNAIGITSATPGATIKFTTDNSDPTTSETSVLYTQPLGRNSYGGAYWSGLTSENGLPVTAFASKGNMFWSDLASTTTNAKLYTLVPHVAINSVGLVEISISPLPDPVPENFVTIHYTTTGTQPTINSAVYSDPFLLTAGANVQAVGVRGTYVSAVSNSVSINQVMAPVIMESDNHIVISTPELGASIYYTTNGNDPEVTYNESTQTYTVGENTFPYNPATPFDYTYSGLTIKAVAVKRNMLNSQIVEGNFILRYPEPSITINPANGEISLAGNGSTHEVFYYTTDGTDPVVSITVSGNDTTYVAGTGTSQYSSPFSIWNPSDPYSPNAKTVKAVTARGRWNISEVASRAFYQTEKCEVAPVVINGVTKIEITSGTVGSTIFYTTDGATMPTCTYDATTHEFTAGTNTTKYTAPLASSYSSSPIFALAVREDMIPDTIKSLPPHLKCKKPIITRDGDILQITSGGFPDDVTIYFTYKKNAGTDEPADPTTSSTVYNPNKIYVMHDDKYPNTPNGDTIFLADAFLNSGEVWNTTITFKAIAVKSGFETSLVSQKKLAYGLQKTDDNWYLIQSDGDLGIFVNLVNHDGAGYNYRLCADVSAEGLPSITNDFSGVLEGSAQTSGDHKGEYYIISDLDHPIFNKLVDGKVRNIMLKNVHISQSGSVGGICCGASGAARVYNCGILPTNPANTEPSTIASTDGQCGSLVGFLDGTARVINCFSYANITGGTVKAGIVGYNNFASVSNNIRTMVMNCMFYGNIVEGNTVAPVYGGYKIHNTNNSTSDLSDLGLNNYNFFRVDADFVKDQKYTPSAINCALAVEDRFLNRIEMYRYLLNSTRDVAVWFVTSSTDNAHTTMAKWVLDKSIAPYPILKVQGTYPSVVNYDPDYTYDLVSNAKIPRNDVTTRNQGGKLGTLKVIIEMGNGGEVFGPPSGAALNSDILNQSTGRYEITLNRIDKDTANYNFNYDKVQLPYYNDVGTKNYTGNRVVTGWKIVSFSGANGNEPEQGTFTTGLDYPAYNFADRKHYAKDLYGDGGSKRIFSQGAYFDVPMNVATITIQPYWAKATYLSDSDYDRTYKVTGSGGNTEYSVSETHPAGTRYQNGDFYSINGDSQKVYTSFSNAIGALGPQGTDLVYDYAIVLVGNTHCILNSTNSFNTDNTKGFTVMSADLDFDNEPDFSLLYFHKQRGAICPIRFDFLNFPGVGPAHRADGSTNLPDQGIFNPKGWFEVTNTCLLRMYQFEYCNAKNHDSPLILQGGYYDQIVSGRNSGLDHPRTQYIHLGGNAWFKLFSNGCHNDYNGNTDGNIHMPVSVTGGEYGDFYLSGMFKSNAYYKAENAEGYIDGGRFGEVAGAGQEKIDGDIRWSIYNADIEQFFGGGVNAVNYVTGNLTTDINNSYVEMYCGGPKFGDMKEGKVVITTAKGCFFGKFFGAGYGGTSYNTFRAKNQDNQSGYEFNDWISDYYKRKYDGSAGKEGIAINYEYELMPFSGFYGSTQVGRFFVNYASLSLATTRSVTSTLMDCTVYFDFYGGGNSGKVDGDATSTLENCTIYGNVFGGGYSASIDSVYVTPLAARYVPNPHFNEDIGNYFIGKLDKKPVSYYWKYTANPISAGHEFDGTDADDNRYILTNVRLSELGTVTGHTKVTVLGNTYVEGLIDGEPVGGVFGGGDEASVGSSEVIIETDMEEDSHAINNVYGGGNIAITEGNTEVTINKGFIGKMENGKVVLGTGNVFGGGRGRLPKGSETLVDAANFSRVHGTTTVNINGGQIRYNVYGGGKLGSVDGSASVLVKGGEVGPLDMSGLNAYVYGGGMGVDVDYGNVYKNFANVASASVTMTGGRVWGSLFGGPADGHVLGDASVTFSGGTLGTWGITSWDGNIFGGGRNYRHTNTAAGRVGGNVTVTMSGGTMLGSVFGGGRLGNVGVNEDGDMQPDSDEDTFYGHISVNISGGTVGNDTLFIVNTEHPNHYIAGSDTIPYHNYHDYIGHVFGGAKGLVGDLNYGQVKETAVTISGSAQIRGSVYGGSENGAVRGSVDDTDKGNTRVNINGGTIGTIAYTHKAALDTDWNAYIHINGGKVFGGGRGVTDYNYAGLVYRNATVEISGGHVLHSVYGGGEMASVGSSGNLETGLATVNVKGGQVGPAPKVESDYNIPVGLDGRDGYVFGGGQGIGDDPIVIPDYPYGRYKDIANVNTTKVTVEMPMDEHNEPVDPEHNRIWGSIFGGGEDGHVLGNAEVYFKGGLMGTLGTTSYDGNIFGGGRNYEKKNYTAGRVGGNINVEMTGGIMYGSIFGGGRLGLTGVDVNGNLIEGDDHGLVTVKVKGGTVGNEDLIPSFTTYSMGDVYGGGKGSMEGIAGHPAASALLISIAKNTIVEISEENPAVPTRILGTVFGGGEVANVGYFTWEEVEGTIGNIQLVSDGLAKVTVSGGTIGADRMRMRHDLVDGTYNLKYNDDVGHVYGGGEGIVADPASYDTVNPGTLGGHNNVSLLDLMATVGSTEVTIGETAWVKGSVYGGSANGHVLGDTYVKIAGGQIGAGDNGEADVRYTDEQFFDPTEQLVDTSNKLFECVSWDYNPSNYHPFDPILVANGNPPTDGKTWFGNVFGGGSGYYPYIKNDTTRWNRASGQVEGNSTVEITGGHILTSVYGGGEVNDIGIMDHTEGQYISGGNATVTMSGGTLGVPRTNEQIQDHPVTCYLFGSGKGDERIDFNTWTNVNHVDVDITGGIIYGSAFGGGEEGHVIGDVELNVSDNAIIGTIGYSNVDGNIFGGGRGFNAEALTAGTVGGNIDVNITGGTMLGSIYGGGRNGSVGTYLVDVTDPNYGKMQHDVEDNPETDEDETQHHGHITVNISGGTIGNPCDTVEEPIGGNVFGGCMGLATSSLWNQIARAKQTEVNITGNPIIKGSVFGGSKEGSIKIDTILDGSNNIVRLDGGTTHVVVQGGTIGWMPRERVHVGGDVYGGGRGYDSNDANAANKRLSGIVERNTTVDISGGHILYNIYGGGEMASVGQTTDVVTIEGKTGHVPVEGTGIATVNFSGGELGPRPNVDGTDGLNGLDGYLFGGGKGVVHEGLTEQEYLDRYKWFGDVNKTVVNMTGGRIWGSLFGGAEDGHVLDDVYISFTEGTIGTHGMTGYDGNIFSGGRNYSDFHTSTGRVGSNIVTRMTGSNCYMLGSMFGGGRQGSVGVDDYGIMKMDEGNKLYGYTNVAITNGVVGHDRQPGEPLVGGNVYGGSKGKAGKRLQGMVKDATVVITGNAQIKNSVMGGGENAHVMGMTHVTVGDATVDGEGKDGHGVVVGIDGIPGEDGNVYGGGRGDETYEENGTIQYSLKAGIVGTSTNVLINDGRIQGSVYGGGRFASVGNEAALTYYTDEVDPGFSPFTPDDFGRTLVTITGDAVIGSKVYDNGHVFGGGRGESHTDFDDFTNVFETFVHITGNAQVNGSVFGGGENGHVVNYTTLNSHLTSLANGKNGNTHVFIDGNAHIGDASADNNETRGNVYGGGRGLDQYLDEHGNMAWNSEAGRVEGNSHATLLNGTVRRYLFGGSNHSIVHGHKIANIENGIVMRDVYGGSKLLDDSWPHPGLKTVNIHGGTVDNVFGCGFNLNDGDPHLYYYEGSNQYQAYHSGSQWYYMDGSGVVHPVDLSQLRFNDAPTSFVNISGGHITESVHGAGQAGMVYGSTLVYFGENAIYHAPNAFNTANVDKDNLYSEKNFFNYITGTGPTPSGNAHRVSKLLVEASVYGGSSYFDNVGGSTTNWSNFTTKGYSNIYIDGTGYDMTALASGWTYESMPNNAMVISGNIYGCGTHCESGEMGRNIIVRNYGNRITSTETGEEGWFTGSTRPMGTIQRVGNLIIDNSNFTLNGQPAIGNDAYEELCAVYKVDSCFYVANGSGITLGEGDVITEMDSIRKIFSGRLKSGNAYSNIFAGKLDWEWIGLSDSETTAMADNLYYYSDAVTPLPYNEENVLVFNTASNDKTSMLHVRYTGRPVDEHNRPILVNGNPMPVKQYYGELQGFFRMKSGLLPWGLKSFAEARPKLTVNNGGVGQGQPQVNDSDGGFLSYQKQFNFFMIDPIPGDDGGATKTKTYQYPYTNDTDGSSKGDREDYRIWVVNKFKGHRWYVDGTRGWGRDGCNDAGSTTNGWGWGMFADRPKKTIKAIFEEGSYLYGSNTQRTFQWKDELVYNEDGSLDEESSKYKDVIYVVGPIDCNMLEEYASLNPYPDEEPLMLYRYAGGHKLSNSTNHDPDDIDPETSGNDSFDETVSPIAPPLNPNTGVPGNSHAGPGPNYDAMINAGARSDNQTVVLNNVFVDGLHNHVGLDKTYLSIPDDYDMNGVSKPMVVTGNGSKLTLKGGTILQRGFNNHEADYFNAAPATAFNGSTPMGGALFVHSSATVNVEGLVDIRYNWQKLDNTTNIKSNVFLPSFNKYLRITGELSSSAHIGITSPVRNDADSYTENTFSPVARGERSGTTPVGGTTVENAVLDAQNAWQNNVFSDDMDGFFGSGTNEQYGSHSTYYKNPFPNYGGSFATDRTLFFGWTWNNVVRSQPEGYVEEGSTVTVSSREGLAWLISKVNGLNNETKSSMEDKTIVLNTDVEGLDKYVWVPVGSTSMSNSITTEQFAGTFDGQGHLIKGLTVAYIGLGDGRYMFSDYGMFGRTNGATINRTFLVDERIEPNSSGNMGGIVGVMQGTGGVISNSEAAVRIEAPTQSSDNGCGGLVGLLVDGTIHSSMAVADITASIGDLGGLVGGALDPKMGTHTDVKVLNSFANVRFDVGSVINENVEVGGIVGDNELASLNNCYSRLLSGNTLPNNHFGTVTAYNYKPVVNCYGQEGNYSINHSNTNGGSESGCGTYTPVIGSDNLGYMYSDNMVNLSSKEEGKATLTARLNRGAYALNRSASRTVADSLYAHWARPGLSEINDDYPVLLLNEFDGTAVYQGSFRSVGTYAGGSALQYGGPVRDGSTDEVSAALERTLEKDEQGSDIPDYLFIYGDVNSVGSSLDITQSKVSIYEHAAILDPGALSASGSVKDAYNNTYVGVSFDNSCGNAISTPGINSGLVGNGPFSLPRDWHMFSTPLSNAPLGFNYTIDNVDQNAAVSDHTDFNNNPNHDDAGFYNNPWKDASGNLNGMANEFTWLTSPGSEECTDNRTGDYRYWMGANVDGYFPYSRGKLFSDQLSPNMPLEDEVENLFIVNSTSTPSDEYYIDGETRVNRYPYGMDFYSWYEPQYHWINFKRNGPNHWHSDGDHVHINYTSEESSNNTNLVANVNETTLVTGKGYMAAIAKETFLQSHGTLNAGQQSIRMTTAGTYYQGWNLVGNPYHAYLNFDAVASGNPGVMNTMEVQTGENIVAVPFYVVYDADRYDPSTGLGSSAFHCYPVGGSVGGDYADKYLHPHQGFFVFASGAEGKTDLNFTESMIVTRKDMEEDHHSSHFRKDMNGESPAYPLVNLYLSSDNGCRDLTVIEFNRPEWSGALKMKELRQGNGLFYARYNESDYAALFVKKGANRVPVRFEPLEDDIFTMRWSHANGEFSAMYLVDNMTGVETDMLTSDSYTFEAHKYDYKSRFYIVFSLAEDYEEDDNSFVFFDGSQWVVMGEGDLDFIDVLGHVLMHTHCSEGLTRLTLPDVACGVYLVRLTKGKDDCKVQKIVITPYE